MSKEQDGEEAAPKQNSEDQKKMKPPNKKKFDEDMDDLTNQIKEREAELERVRQIGAEIKGLKAERMEFVNKRKQISIDLDRLNKEIPDRMKRLNEIEASLYYKSEDKINSAIQRLEWNLRVKTYKLMEEKKIVSEIDGLKRSKKNLVQYVALRHEINEIRDRQKGLRDGRDRCIKEFNRLKAKEDGLRNKNRNLTSLKKEIDSLYDQRRQTNANFKQQRGEFHDLKEKHRKGSWKKKVEERKAYEEEKRKEMDELEAESLPHDSDLRLCHSLMAYLHRLLPTLTTDSSQDSFSPSSSQDDPEPAEEMEGGQIRLVKKSDDGDTLDNSQSGMRRLSKRNKKLRKPHMDKKIAHASDVLSQFMSLNLMVPSSLSEVPAVLEQLETKQSFFEKEQQQCEATSDAGISATESALCAMSRQASKTESCDGGTQESSSRPDDSVYAALLQQQDNNNVASSDKDELYGAVGGRPDEDDWSTVVVGVGSDTPNSDSTIEGDTSSGESQKVIRRLTGVDCNVTTESERTRNVKAGDNERWELKRSLAMTVSNSSDSSMLTDHPAQITSIDEDFPSLLESSQSSLTSELSFPSLGASSSNILNPKQDGGSNVVTVSPSSSKSSTHRPLTKTSSVVTENVGSNNETLKSKSYASSVVSRARSFSEVMTKRPGNSSSGDSSNTGGTTSSADNNTATVWNYKFGKSGQQSAASSKQVHPAPSYSSSSKQVQPPSSLSLSFSSAVAKQSASTPSPSATAAPKQRPSIHRSRTLTPTLTRSWTEVRTGDRKKSGAGGEGKITQSVTDKTSIIAPSTEMTSDNDGWISVGGTTASRKNSPKTKTPISPSLSSSAIPSPHRSTLSPRLSYPLQSKLSPSPSTPTQPIIIINDDKDFPPLGQTATPPRRNSNLSTKSSGGSNSQLDSQQQQPQLPIAPHRSDNNNNSSSGCVSSSSNNLPQTQPPLSAIRYTTPIEPTTPTSVWASSSHHLPTQLSVTIKGTKTTTTTDSAVNQPNIRLSHPDMDPGLSSIPKGDRFSTEKWVESSVAFVQDMTASLSSERLGSGIDPDIEVTSL